jgi:autotransporter-associated beta strand protein
MAMGSSESINRLSGAGTVNVAISGTGAMLLTVGENNGSATYAGILKDTDSTHALRITKIGTGTQVLSGANAYTGGTSVATTVSAGTLQVTQPASLPGYGTSGEVSVASGATLAVNSADAGGTTGWLGTNIDTLLGTTAFVAGSNLGIDTSNGDFAYATNIGTGTVGKGLTKLGPNTLDLSSATLTYTGNTLVSAGTLKVGTLNTSPTVTVTGSGSALSAASLVADTLTIGAGGSVTIRETTGAAGASAVPEPTTWVLIGTALLGLLAVRRRR